MIDPFAAPPAEDEAQAAPAAPEPAFEPPPAPAPAKAPAKKAAPKKAVGEATVDVKPNTLPIPDTGLSVTFKGGTGFDAPWLVPKYTSVTEALLDLGVPEEKVSGLSTGQQWLALMERVQVMAQHFVKSGPQAPAGGSSGGGRGGSTSQAQPAPQAAQEAPGGEERFCAHGKMRFRSGVSKAGKPYSAFFCGSGDRNNECKAQFLR